MSGEQPAPELSVVVVVYNIPREAPRTLLSLSAGCQRHVDVDRYEVIVVDNGSDPPLDPNVIANLPGNFRLIRLDQASASPACAINRGLAAARGDVVGVMIDGARLVTPGLLHFAQHGVRLYDRSVVTALGWYLGADFQRYAIPAGYNQAREDALLASIEWPQDGYRLFEIATLDETSVDGWFAPLIECNAIFLKRALWDELGGIEERFDAPGGGLLNHDTLRRAFELPGVRHVVLLGEGSFHQLHGGIATNAGLEDFPETLEGWRAQYERIRGEPHRPAPQPPRTYVGTLPSSMMARFVRAAVHPVSRGKHREPPLGRRFDPARWSDRRPVRSADPKVAAATDVALAEFRAGRYPACAAVARLIRAHAPDEPEPQRLLAMIGTRMPNDRPAPKHAAFYHLALGEAHRRLGYPDTATYHYREALGADADLTNAHIGLASVRMPGERHYVWLDRLHQALVPETMIEIGIGDGASLARARRPTRVFAVDPAPSLKCEIEAETHIFVETSDMFFFRRRPMRLLRGQPLGLGFIDGLHLYEQALKDFMHLEPYCGPRSVLLLHDTVPLDEPTQSRTRRTRFYTGDVWKTVLCLRHFRPDLDIFTIATPWTGLTVVTGLDPTSRVLSDAYDPAVAQFIDMPFSEIEGRMEEALNMVANDWSLVAARLKARGILER